MKEPIEPPKNIKLLTEAEATAAGYKPITTEYNLPLEAQMLERAIGQLGSIDKCLVQQPNGIELWRGGQVKAEVE